MFSYNCKTGCIMMNEKRIVRYDKVPGAIYFYVKDRGSKRYLIQKELIQLAKTVKWLIEERGCDFGEDINSIATSYLAA